MMTVESNYAPQSYAANGVTTSFAFPFSFFEKSDLLITVYSAATNSSILALLDGGGTYDYTITGTFDPDTAEYLSGADVVFNTAPPSGYTVTIERDVPAIQPVVLANNSRFPAKTVEGALDRMVLLSQQQSNLLTRAIRRPPADGSLSMVLPVAVERANHFLVFNGDGSVGISTKSVDTIEGGSMPASGGIVTNYTSLRAFGVTAQHVGELIYVRGYSATGDGGEGWFRVHTTPVADDDCMNIVSGTSGYYYKRQFTGPGFVEWAGAKDDNGTTDNGLKIRAAITAFAAAGVRSIGFLGRSTGIYACSSKIIDAGDMPDGLSFFSARIRGGNDAYDGCIIKYTGTGGCWDVRFALGTQERGQWEWDGFMFWCSNNAGTMFLLDYYTTGGTDYTCTFDNTTPHYLRNVRFKNSSFWGSGLSSTGRAIQAKKTFELIIDDTCYFRDWARAVDLVGCDACVIEGRYIGNGRHVQIVASGVFGNDNKINPTTMGSTYSHGEDCYHVYDTGYGTRYLSGVMEDGGNARALFYFDGFYTSVYSPRIAAACPFFELGPHTNDIVIVAPTCPPGGTVGAPIYADPVSWEMVLNGLPIVTIINANIQIADVIGIHPRVRFITTSPGSKPKPVNAPRINSDRVERWKDMLIDPTYFPARWSGVGLGGITGMVANAAASTGYVIRIPSGNLKGFIIPFNVPYDFTTNSVIRLSFRYKMGGTVSSGSWRWYIGKNFSPLTDGAIPNSTTMASYSVAYTFTGLSPGDTIQIGVQSSSVDQLLDLDSMVIAHCQPFIADTSGATLGDLELEVNKIKRLLKDVDLMGGT